jgi:hypothetical protein
MTREEVSVGRINWARVILGGIGAGIASTALEGALGFLMRSEWQAAMKSRIGAVMGSGLSYVL